MRYFLCEMCRELIPNRDQLITSKGHTFCTDCVWKMIHTSEQKPRQYILNRLFQDWIRTEITRLKRML